MTTAETQSDVICAASLIVYPMCMMAKQQP